MLYIPAEKSYPARWGVRARGAMVAAVVLALIAAVLAVSSPAFAEEEASEAIDFRAWAVQLMRSGGPSTARAAEVALAGSDEELQTFFVNGLRAASEQDDQAQVNEYLAAGGYTTRQAAQQALAGTSLQQVTAFVPKNSQISAMLERLNG